MFDVRNATEQSFDGDLILPFKYWVAFPRISRADWKAKWGESGYCPPEFLFAEDMDGLADRLLSVGKKQLANAGLNSWPSDQIAAVSKAFGDSAVLYHRPEDREGRRVEEGTLGEMFDEAAEKYKNLSDEQQKLSAQNWHEGPRLVRGVAGSGKTIVLANNLARRLQRNLQERGLFADQTPRILAVCNNRSLVPFLQKKIALAFEQRTGNPLPAEGLEVFSYNKLLYHLAQKGMWRYQQVGAGSDEERAANYQKELAVTKASHPEIFDAWAYDAIFVDEGQDFLEEDFRLLKELCRVRPEQEPNLYVFYDDAQNFLGRKRPNWSSVGLNVRGGRSNVMSLCFRNTCPIVEAAFNVLYGSCADGKGEVPTKEFGDIATLEEKHAIVKEDDGYWRVGFAVRDGLPPKFTVASSASAETQQIISRLHWLIEEQRVRPQDILVLGFSQQRMRAIYSALANTKIAGVEGLHLSFEKQDLLLGQRGTLTLSTTASAKGYDAYCVLLASANEFNRDAIGRISFYVGCTRAIDYLEVFAYRREGLAAEWERVLGRQRGT